jgi:hypothetical protein
MPNVMLTTIDNPYNPFTQYDEWYVFDRQCGYNTPSYLARVIKTSDELSELDQDQAYLLAVNDIISFDPNNIYLTVSEAGFEAEMAAAKA